MGRTLGELFDSMAEGELELWLAFHTYVEPIPDPWQIGALQAALFCSAHTPKGRRGKGLSDFYPVRRRAKKQMSQDQIRAKMMRAMELLNGNPRQH